MASNPFGIVPSQDGTTLFVAFDRNPIRPYVDGVAGTPFTFQTNHTASLAGFRIGQYLYFNHWVTTDWYCYLEDGTAQPDRNWVGDSANVHTHAVWFDVPASQLYVADSADERLYVYNFTSSGNGNFSLAASYAMIGVGSDFAPRGLTDWVGDNLLITDRDNDRLLGFSKTGERVPGIDQDLSGIVDAPLAVAINNNVAYISSSAETHIYAICYYDLLNP